MELSLAPKLLTQAGVFGTSGALLGYLVSPQIPVATAGELTQVLGNISAIAGSLLGWSVAWLSQSRALIKEIDYDAARHLFRELGDLHKELILRWAISLAASLGTMIVAVILRTAPLEADVFRYMFTVSTGILMIALGFIAYLFQRMLALAKLRSDLDDYEHDELRKKRNVPEH